MKQTLLIFTAIFGLLSCNQPSNKLLGSWDNKNGQILDFRSDGKAHWIFYDETTSDTFEINYTFNHSTEPNQLDLTGFKAGPLTGKTLYGIIEFQGNDVFRFDCEPTSESRPETFDSKQTQTYHKKK